MDGARHKPLQEQSARWEVSVCSNAFEYPFLKFVQRQFSMIRPTQHFRLLHQTAHSIAFHLCSQLTTPPPYSPTSTPLQAVRRAVGGALASFSAARCARLGPS